MISSFMTLEIKESANGKWSEILNTRYIKQQLISTHLTSTNTFKLEMPSASYKEQIDHQISCQIRSLFIMKQN